MPGDNSPSDVLERMYTNQLALGAALMGLTLHVEQRGASEVRDNIRAALDTIGENDRRFTGHLAAPQQSRHKPTPISTSPRSLLYLPRA
ncbi:hypothetical protein ACI77J_26910 [Pseudomonas sp. O64]|uniref:hypothetical protein n=1 Tax=unclassified Pseudomonas TaxID=196821 RepID=UPI0021D96ACF|nr:hypothetical protein [Pseudomonas sp. YeP6b]UXZ25603.1 hypothetical protein KZH41_09500 [Pseudomonas sp. YeP6b]